MYGILPCWIKIWLICSTLICSIDVAFTMLRSESLRGGAYDNYFFLWHFYADVDSRYADELDPVTRITGTLMCVELALNILALFLDFFRPCHALLTAFTSSIMVCWKTTFYLSLYIDGSRNNASVAHNSYGIAPNIPSWKVVLLFWVPNSVWVFIPLLVMFKIWRIIARGWNSRMEDADEMRPKCSNTLLISRRGSRIYKSMKGNGEMWALDELDPEDWNGNDNYGEDKMRWKNGQRLICRGRLWMQKLERNGKETKSGAE